MKPLAAVAMGLVIVVLVADQGGYDLLADPVGWLLVVLGVRRLPDPTTLLALAVAAGVVACALWLPATQDLLERSDPSLQWAVNLPQVVFCVALCHRLAGLATAAGDARAAAWLRTAMVLNVLLALAPVVVFAAGAEDLLSGLYAAAGAVLVLLIVLLFGLSGRSWADASVT